MKQRNNEITNYKPRISCYNKNMAKRIFIAINFPTQFLQEELEKIKKELEGEPIKWVKRENIHLTILFIGTVPLKKIKLINEAIEKNIKILPRFKMELISLGSFSRVIWIGAKIEKKDLEKFQKILQDNLKKNFTIGEQRFVPHITIGRIKGKINRKRLEELIKKYKNHYFGSVIINSVDIMESKLKREGAEYEVVRKYELL